MDIEKCEEELAYITEELKLKRREYDNKVKECEEKKHRIFITTYFDNKELTHCQLIVGLQRYYKDEKEKNPDFVLSLKNFIDMFPQKSIIKGTNYKKQHIFEALCRIILLFNYDNNVFGYNKKFRSGIERNIKQILSDKEILDMKVNAGNSAGSVDICFSVNDKTDDEKQAKLWACEKVLFKTPIETLDETCPLVCRNPTELQGGDGEKKIIIRRPKKQPKKYILIQNKYYDTEKSNISCYDVDKIYTLFNLINEYNIKNNLESNNRRIVLMVNNKESLSNKIEKCLSKYPNLFDKENDIFGTFEINEWFQRMLYDLLTKSFEDFKAKVININSKSEIQLRFHQEYIVNTTLKYIERDSIKKYIWGAVPRSGKSYMIGGLVNRRKELGNDIVIILGAKTETYSQFYEMFDKNSNFDEYNIIGVDKYSKGKENNKEKSIYLISQEWMKDKIQNETYHKGNRLNPIKGYTPEKATFTELKDLRNLINKKGKIDLYFDEIHKGGSTDRSEEILHAFKNADIKIDLFVMVTATFAKPIMRYSHIKFVDDNSKHITIEWSYEDQQNMKHLENETKMNIMIDSRKEEIEKDVLRECFNKYRDYYGLSYLSELSKEYQKHPELVLITPELLNKADESKEIIDFRNILIQNLKCDACKTGQSKEYYKNSANIFINSNFVEEMLDYISNKVYNSFFNCSLGYDPKSNKHTELWFLPDRDLYLDRCNDICKKEVKETNMDEDDDVASSIPNIEPLTRGLSFKLMQNRYFKNNYNIFIVHGANLKKLYGFTEKEIFEDFEGRITVYNNKESISDQIKREEKIAYSNNKSLIILTGAKLRLGISLPCANMAFNFDNISMIDANYQTMFRVLTERTQPELKKYGYYVDFNKDRAIKFMYEYDKVYGKGKLISNPKESYQHFRNLLFMFNFNGLGITMKKCNEKEELKLYNNLLSQFNYDNYFNHFVEKSNIEVIFKKSLYGLNDNARKILGELLKITKFEVDKSKPKKSKIELLLRKGKAMDTFKEAEDKLDQDEDVEQKHEVNEEDEDEDDVNLTLSQELIFEIITLLAVFSNNNTKGCNTLTKCLRMNIKDIKELDREKIRCDCKTINKSNIFHCYYNNLEASELIKLLEKLREFLIESPQSLPILNTVFNNIYEKINDEQVGGQSQMRLENIKYIKTII